MMTTEDYLQQSFELARGALREPGREGRGGALREPGATLLEACCRKAADPETDVSAEVEALQAVGRGIGGTLAGGSGKEAGPLPPELKTDLAGALQQLSDDITAEQSGNDPLQGLDPTSIFSLAFVSVRIGAFLALTAQEKLAECPQNAL